MRNLFNSLFNKWSGKQKALDRREREKRAEKRLREYDVGLYFAKAVAIARMNLPAGSQHLEGFLMNTPPGMNFDGSTLFLEKLLTLDKATREKILASLNGGAIPPDSLLQAELLVRKRQQQEAPKPKGPSLS